jgi:hypothetical protein
MAHSWFFGKNITSNDKIDNTKKTHNNWEIYQPAPISQQINTRINIVM